MCNTAGNTYLGAGTYIAMLGDSWTFLDNTGPKSVIARVLDPLNDHVYTLPNGSVVATGKADLFAGVINHAVNMDEMSNAVVGASVWTASYANGTYANYDCNGWGYSSGWNIDSGYVGNSSATDGTWLYNATPIACTLTARIYCIQN
jgi:hypothetical protein